VFLIDSNPYHLQIPWHEEDSNAAVKDRIEQNFFSLEINRARDKPLPPTELDLGGIMS
jgi:hypothetical protein